MKIKNLLILSVVALLASCGQQAPAGYNTTVNLPEGGNEVAETERDQKAGDAIQDVVSGLDLTHDFSFGGEVSVDVGVKTTSTGYDYLEEKEYTSTTEVSMSGKVKFSIMHATPKKASLRVRVFTSRLSLVFEGLSYTMNMSGGDEGFNMSLNNLSFGLHYVYSSDDNYGVFLFDLSDSSVKALAEQYVNEYIDSNEDIPDAAKATAKAQMNAALTKLLVTDGGKFYADQSDLIAMIQGIMAKMGGQSSNEDDSGMEPLEAADNPTEMIMQLLDGDIVGNVLSMLQMYMPENPGETIAAMMPTLLQALPFLFKEYKNSNDEVVQYGFGFNINQDNAKEFITMVASSVMSMMGGMMGGTDTIVQGAPEDGETDPTGEESFDLPAGLKFSLGFAMMIGKTHGSTTFNLESISMRFSVEYLQIVDARGALSVDFYYGEQVADLIGDETAYTIDLVATVQEMMGGSEQNN